MADRVNQEDLMRFLDGEMPPEERRQVEMALEGSTELRRDLHLFEAMKQDLQELTFTPVRVGESIWDQVNVRVTRPVGWVIFLAGALVWIVYGGWVYFTSSIHLWEKLATGAVVTGLVSLLATVIWERYRAWLTDPYKDVHR